MTRRWLTCLALTAAMLLVGSAALADPAGPTHFRSTVTEVTPADGLDGIDVDILGGDAFLVLRVPDGVEVQVPGYEGEPYLRFAADGTVEVNSRSPARWLNDARFGAEDVEVPPQADADAPPQWERVARDGEYGWHDHRIHFMSPALPRTVDESAGRSQHVLDWTVPLLVADDEVQVRGELRWLPGPAPLVPIGALVLAVAGGVAVAHRWRSSLPWLIVAGGLLAGGVGLAARLAAPPGGDTDPASWVLPLLALGVLAGAVSWGRRDPVRAGWVVPAAALPLAVWAAVQFGTLTRPIVPGPVPEVVVRVIVAFTVAVAVAALDVLARRALATTALDEPV